VKKAMWVRFARFRKTKNKIPRKECPQQPPPQRTTQIRRSRASPTRASLKILLILRHNARAVVQAPLCEQQAPESIATFRRMIPAQTAILPTNDLVSVLPLTTRSVVD